MNKLNLVTNKYIKEELPEIKPGYTVRIHQKIKESGKERIQIFEGVVIAIKHGLKNINSSITVRKVSEGIGVEKIIPVHSPNVVKIEVIKKSKTRRAKLYYLRKKSKKESRLKKE